LIPSKTKRFFFSLNNPTGSAVDAASYSVDIGESFSGGWSVWAWRRPLASI